MSEKDKGGRPTEFDEKYVKQAFTACRRGGFSQSNLAELFGVAKSTITEWKNKHPDFAEAIKDGQQSFKVGAALFRRATGIRYTETMVETIMGKDDEGKPVVLEITKEKKTKKFIPPDTRAAEMFLTNRDPDRWKTKQNIELTGADGGPVIMQVKPE